MSDENVEKLRQISEKLWRLFKETADLPHVQKGGNFFFFKGAEILRCDSKFHETVEGQSIVIKQFRKNYSVSLLKSNERAHPFRM